MPMLSSMSYAEQARSLAHWLRATLLELAKQTHLHVPLAHVLGQGRAFLCWTDTPALSAGFCGRQDPSSRGIWFPSPYVSSHRVCRRPQTSCLCIHRHVDCISFAVRRAASSLAPTTDPKMTGRTTDSTARSVSYLITSCFSVLCLSGISRLFFSHPTVEYWFYGVICLFVRASPATQGERAESLTAIRGKCD